MISIGLDLSLTHSGWAIVDDSGKVLGSGVVKSKPCGDKPLDETRRIVKIAEDCVQTIDRLCRDYYDVGKGAPDIICIEGLAFMAQGTSLVQLAGLNYLTRILLAEFEWPFVIVAPTSLKKFITGSGKGDKDQMQMAVYKYYGHEALDNNECDAYSLAVCGLALLDKPLRKVLKPQEEVLKLLKKQL